MPLRIAQLRELCLRRGQSWDALQRQLSGVLADRLIYAVRAGAVDADLSEHGGMEAAGLSLERRLEICRELVGDAPVEERSIVWMAYGNADVPGGFLKKGPVQFFSHQLPLSSIRDGCPALETPEFEPPDELRDPLSEGLFSRLPDAPFVWVRVVVDGPQIADVRRHARELASGLVEAADRDSHWILLDGEAVFSGGGWWGTLGFDDPQLTNLFVRGNPLHQPTGELLKNLEDSFVSALVAGDEAALGALAQRRWETAVAAAQDPAQRVALSMRILEHALPIARAAGESVRDSSERYLKEAWVMSEFGQELRDAAYYGIWSLSRQLSEGPAIQRELLDAILPSMGGLSFHFKPRVFIERVPDLLGALDEATIQHRWLPRRRPGLALRAPP